MKYLEVIYETGAHSVMAVESEEEAKRGLSEHHRRAVEGAKAQVNDPNYPFTAERIKKVLRYDRHPGDYGEAQALSADVAKEHVLAALKVATDDNGVTDLRRLQAELNEAVYPMRASGPHETNFKMKESGELKGDWS